MTLRSLANARAYLPSSLSLPPSTAPSPRPLPSIPWCASAAVPRPGRHHHGTRRPGHRRPRLLRDVGARLGDLLQRGRLRIQRSAVGAQRPFPAPPSLLPSLPQPTAHSRRPATPRRCARGTLASALGEGRAKETDPAGCSCGGGATVLAKNHACKEIRTALARRRPGPRGAVLTPNRWMPHRRAPRPPSQARRHAPRPFGASLQPFLLLPAQPVPRGRHCEHFIVPGERRTISPLPNKGGARGAESQTKMSCAPAPARAPTGGRCQEHAVN